MKELDETFWIQKTKIVHLFTIEHGCHGDYWLGEEWNEGLVVTFVRDCHLFSTFANCMIICCMLEPHHFVTQPFRHPFPLLCMLSTPSKYNWGFPLKMLNSSAKNLMSLAENLSSVWSFFPLKLSTSPMPRTSHPELSHLCGSFSHWLLLAFANISGASLLFSCSCLAFFQLLKTFSWASLTLNLF